MKKVSIIVPVYNVEKYLERSLKSIVNQTLEDIEIIIVNDGSKDKSQEIIDKYKKEYPDKIIALEKENQGASSARNYALERATGEYIGFVDSDDYIAIDMFEKMYKEAKEKDADIVCCDYYRVDENEKYIRKYFGNTHIKKEEVADKNVYESQLLFDEVPYLWNKIFRTSIIKDNDFTFDKELRIYEDLLFVYKCFGVANKISIIEDPMYYYIVSRNGSLTSTLSEKRLDIFKVADKLTEFYKKIGKYEEVKEALQYVVIKHIYVILEKDTLKEEKTLKKAYIKKAFSFLNDNFKNWKNNMFFDLQDKPKLLYSSKLYWLLCLKRGKNIFFDIKKINRFVVKIYLLLFEKKSGKNYIKLLNKPLDEKTVFVYSQQGKNLNGNMFYIFKEIATNERYKDYKIYLGCDYSFKQSFIKLLRNYKILDRAILVNNGTKKFTKALAKSKYIFSDTSLPNYYIKKEGQIYVNTWHGTPLKTLGKSTENDFYDIANVQKNFAMADYLLYPNEFMKDIMIEDYMLKGIANNNIMMCGYPRNEIYFQKQESEIKEKLDAQNKTLIAYMPTWRGCVRTYDIEQQLLVAKEHIKQISERLNENQILYVNMHPFIGNSLDLSEFKNVRFFPKEYETYHFLSTCDILITDYSSVFFDFATSNKKIILFVYDKEEYFRDRGVYLNIDELPFPKVKNITDLIKEINSEIKYDNREFTNKYCKYDNSCVSKLICEKVILNENNLIKMVKMPQDNREKVLVCPGNFDPDQGTMDFIEMIKDAKDSEYNFIVSYITKYIKNNKKLFKMIVNKINYFGQLGRYTSEGIKGKILLILLKKKKNFVKYKSQYERIFKTEIERIYGNINFKAIFVCGRVDFKKMYELCYMNGKKILYINNKDFICKGINNKVYDFFDVILVDNEETLKKINKCTKNKNIEIVGKLTSMDEIKKYI